MRWKSRQEMTTANGDGEDGCEVVDYGDREDEEERVIFDSHSFSRLLLQVPWSDVKRFSKLAFLCNKAYQIPDIKV